MHQLRADMARDGRNYELFLDWANRAHGVRTRCRTHGNSPGFSGEILESPDQVQP